MTLIAANIFLFSSVLNALSLINTNNGLDVARLLFYEGHTESNVTILLLSILTVILRVRDEHGIFRTLIMSLTVNNGMTI